MADLTSMLQAASGSGGGEPDPFFNQTTLLLHGDGTNGAQNNTFLDSSTNNFTINRNGNTTQGTFSPFSVAEGEWSNFFDGTSDNLSVANNAAFQFGTGDFTVEAWVYQTVQRAEAQVIVKCAADQTWNTGWALALGTSNSVVSFWVNGSNVSSSGASTVTLNGWSHVAVSRSGTTLKMFINGVEVDSDTNSTSIVPTVALTVGADITSSTYEFQGYISNVRLVKGRAVYTSNFTPPTTPLGATSGGDDPPQGAETSLLTCQSNRFVDNSGTPKTITANGNVAVQPFSPFQPSSAYSTSVNGGSGFFDGTGDFLDIGSSNSGVSFGTSNFTIQCWIYPRTIVSEDGLLTGSDVGWVLYFFPGSKLQWGRISPQSPANLGATTASVSTNAWTHVEVTRSSGTVRIFLNGVLNATIGDAGDYSANGKLRIGRSHSSLDFDGYISDVQVIKGTALHTASFTPPTAPLTAVAGTSILCNFTNAGIFDNTGKNNLATIGNAQIDTSVKKYGTGSMEFDGTGDWLLLANNVNQQLGTGNFTIEFWVYLATGDTGSNRGLVAKGTSTTGFLVSLNTTEKVVFTFATSTITSTGAITLDAWNHIAVVREGTGSNQTKIYIAGTNDGTGTVSTDFNQTSVMYVGANRTGGDPMKGYIDDLRITKGVAVYTANFTPPTAAFPDQ